MFNNGNEREKCDWKECLPVEDEAKLNELLEATRRHRCAYKSAENVQIAQIWCAMIETMKMVDKLDQRVAYIERVLDRLFRGYEGERGKLLEGLLKF